MAHDDFMYGRREEPRKAFVEDLRETLRKQEQKRMISSPLWKRIASIIAGLGILSVILLGVSPDVRAFVVRTLGMHEWIAVNEDDAQDYFAFAIPQDIPEGYERRTAIDDEQHEGDVFLTGLDMGRRDVLLGHIVWRNDESNCWIMMIVQENLNSPENLESNMARNEYYAERYDWIEVFDVAGVGAVWRLKTSGGINNMEIEWISTDNVLHRLETSTECMSQAAFIALAQSVE